MLRSMMLQRVRQDLETEQQLVILGLPWWLSGKELTCQCRRQKFYLWVRKIPWNRAWQPTSVFLSRKSHRQRSLAGYSPWGHKELDTTEHTLIPKSFIKKEKEKKKQVGTRVSFPAGFLSVYAQ